MEKVEEVRMMRGVKELAEKMSEEKRELEKISGNRIISVSGDERGRMFFQCMEDFFEEMLFEFRGELGEIEIVEYEGDLHVKAEVGEMLLLSVVEREVFGEIMKRIGRNDIEEKK